MADKFLDVAPDSLGPVLSGTHSRRLIDFIYVWIKARLEWLRANGLEPTLRTPKPHLDLKMVVA